MVRTTAARFLQTVIFSFTVPSPAPPFRNIARSAEQQSRMAPSFQINKVPNMHPILNPSQMQAEAMGLLDTLRHRVLAMTDPGLVSGNIGYLTALFNIFLGIIQYRTQFDTFVTSTLVTFYRTYQDPILRVERKSLEYAISSLFNTIVKWNIGSNTTDIQKCLSGHITRENRLSGMPDAKRISQSASMSSIASRVISQGKREAQFAPPPQELTTENVSESLCRIALSVSQRINKTTSRLLTSYSILSRFSSTLAWDDPTIKSMSEIIASSAPPQQIKAFLVSWLYTEFNSKLAGLPEAAGPSPDPTNLSSPTTQFSTRYAQVLDIALNTFAASDILPSIIQEAPLLTDNAFVFLENQCRTSRQCDLPLGCLKSLVIIRPPYRLKSLNMLLALSTEDSNLTLQTKAIANVKELCQYHFLENDIVHFAINHFTALLKVPEVIKREEEVKLQNEQNLAATSPSQQLSAATPLSSTQVSSIISKYTSLYLQLCIDRPQMLKLAVEVYSQWNAPEFREALARSIIYRARSVGSDEPTIIELVTDPLPNSEKLALDLCEVNGASPLMAQSVLASFNMGKLDAKFLALVFFAFSKQEAIAILPKLFTLPQAGLHKLISSALTKTPTPLPPDELLFQLHVIDTQGTGVSLKDLAMLINMCFEDPSKAILKQELLGTVLTRLLSVSPLPVLLFRTILLTITHCKVMSSFILGILEKPPLFSPQVWNDRQLWLGFMNVCEKLLPATVRILLDLPLTQFQNVLSSKPTIKEVIQQRMLQGGAIPQDKLYLLNPAPAPESAGEATDAMDTSS